MVVLEELEKEMALTILIVQFQYLANIKIQSCHCSWYLQQYTEWNLEIQNREIHKILPNGFISLI